MKKSTLTSLNYLLLGLIDRKPQSGYAICRELTKTPMGHFSNSPGSIYPALNKMEASSLIRGKLEGATLRPRKLFCTTPKGKRLLKAWILSPITKEILLKQPDFIALKLSFADSVADTNQIRIMLEDIAKLAAQTLIELESFYSVAANNMSLGGRLALEMGIAQVKGQLKWSEESKARLA